MAKGQMKGNKDAKKPKADKPKSAGSAYKLSQGASGQATISPTEEEVIEAAGVEFAAENGAGPCVRLRKVKLTRPLVLAD
jgi:hypothetical protein